MAALTADMIEEAANKAKESFGMPNIVRLSSKQMSFMIEYQKYQDWLSSLPPRTRRQVVLKDKIKARRGQKHKRY